MKDGKANRDAICVFCRKPFQKQKLRQKLCSINCYEQYYEVVYKDTTDLNNLYSGEEPEYEDDGIEFIESREDTVINEFYNKCEICGSIFKSAYPETTYCSRECLKILQSKKLREEYNEKIEYIKCFVSALIDKALAGGERDAAGKFVDYYNLSGFTTRLKEEILERDGYKCQVCESRRSLHVHHIVPRKQGGNHKKNNLITLCARCHGSIETKDKVLAIKKCTRNAGLINSPVDREKNINAINQQTEEYISGIVEAIVTSKIIMDTTAKERVEQLMFEIYEDIDKF